MIAIAPSTGRAVSWGRGSGYLMTPVCHLSPIDGPGRNTWIAADPTACRVISSTKVCGKNWCSPAYVDGKLLVRDSESLRCLELVP